MSDSEQGISQVRIAAAQSDSSRNSGLEKHHRRNIAYLDERIFIYLFALAFIGLFVLWASVSSALVLYVSLGVVFLLLILWGYARISRIRRIERYRELQVKATRSDAREQSGD